MDTRQRWSFTSITEGLNQSVRPFLAYAFGIAVIAFTYLAYLTPDAFLAIAGMVIGFFFRGRDEEKTERRLEQQQAQLVELAREVPVAPPERR